MKRRIALALAVSAAGTAATLSTPSGVVANTGLCPQPSVTGVSPQVAAAGATVTVTGANLSGIACTTSVTVGGVTQQVTSVQPGSITFAAGSGLHGGVQVVIKDSLSGYNESNANLTFFNPVSASGVSPAAPTAGQGTTVGGHGFSLGLPAGDERVSAAYLWSDGTVCAGASATVASDSAIAVSAPGHYCDGPLSLSITAAGDLNNPGGSLLTLYAGVPGSIDVAASGAQLANPTATAGGSVTVQGSGFGNAGSATLGGEGVSSTWSDGSVVVRVPDSAVSNSPVSLTRAADGGVIAVPGAVNVVARVDSIAPSSAAPGATVTISGGGFGSHPGSVALGPTNLPVTGWSPTSITATVPPGAASGTLTIVPVDTSPPASQPALTVVQQVHIGSSGANGGSAGTGASHPAPLTPEQVQAVTSALSAAPPSLPPTVVGGRPPSLPPSHPTSGPLSLSLRTPRGTVAPGKSVPFTVTLRAYGQPVSNAAVQLVIAFEPAPDGSVTPTSGVTDAQGQLHGVVHLSRTPGEMIVLARAGIVSDELRLIGSTATAAAASAAQGPVAAVQHALPIAVVALASLFLLAGVGLRLALVVGSGGSLRAALLRERLTESLPAVCVRRVWPRIAGALSGVLVRRGGISRDSGRNHKTAGDRSGELDVPRQLQPQVTLGAVDAHPAAEQPEERVGVAP